MRGAGFVGSNLIHLLLKKTKYNILSLDNYSKAKKILKWKPLINFDALITEMIDSEIKNY